MNDEIPNPDFCINFKEIKEPSSYYCKIQKLGEEKYHLLKKARINKIIDK